MINSYTEFQPLKTVFVGSVYEDSFFDDISNTTIREGLKEIVSSTREDIDNFKKIIESRNISVYQFTPNDLEYHKSIMDYIGEDGSVGKDARYSRDGYRNGIPMPPLSIRDDAIVMGQNLLVTDPYPYHTELAIPKYKKLFGDAVDTRVKDDNISFVRSIRNIKIWAEKNRLKINDDDIDDLQAGQKLGGFCAPNLTRVGKTILVDLWQAPNILDEYLEKYWPEYEYKKVFIGGHNDSVFSVIRPGLVLASKWFEPYKHMFPESWDIIWFHETDWERTYLNQKQMKNNNTGCYWYPEKKENPQLENFINNWLTDWHGQSDESIFDVNVLMLDEKTCVINSESPYLMKELEKRDIEPLHIPLRNRFFWDGGWHCNTLDIYREGDCEDYGL